MLASIHPFRLILLPLFIFFIWAQPQAAEKEPVWLADAEKQLKLWQKDVAKWNQSPPLLAELEKRQNEAFSLKQKSDSCVTELTSQMDSLLLKLKALGDETEAIANDLKNRQKELNRQKTSIESELAVCRLLSLGIRELMDSHQTIRNRLLSQALSHREQPVWETLTLLTKDPVIFSPDFKFNFTIWPSILGGLITFFILFPLSRSLSVFLNSKYFQDNNKPSSSIKKLITMLGKRLPWMALLASFALFGYLGGAKIISLLLLVFLISVFLAPFLELLLCHNTEKCPEGLPARISLDIVLFGFVFHFSGIQAILSENSYMLAKTSYYLFLMIFSLWLLFSLSKRENLPLLISFRIPLAVALLAGPIASLIGYHSLSDLLIPGVYGTLASFTFFTIIFQSGNLLISMFEPDDPNTNNHLRHFIGYEKQEVVPGLWIAKLLLIASTIVGFIYWLLYAWKVPYSVINILHSYFSEGFSVGAVTIIPSKIILAILVFFLFMTLVGWLKTQLNERWLRKSRLDAGAKESIVALSSYAIIGIAMVISLSLAGVDFQNVAIVAGALSVGIGFGLQNIVNNFVSGLILLFERPVKPGDWVVVGSTEGHIKKISIRYTMIETFDRADVLVPNSELISGQMTNWMLTDLMGRVIVPVGVAYGSDTGKVREILKRIAREHPFVVMNNKKVSDPKVVFMSFGDSSLNFEIRCFIKDIDNRLTVRSDMLFSIDEAFRQEGIEIPFPQRVVHLTGSGPDKTPEQLAPNNNENE